MFTKNFSALFVVAVVAAGFSTSSLFAGHRSYCYSGRCYGYAAEEHLIDALDFMDHALAADCPRERYLAIQDAMVELRFTRRELRSSRSRYELVVAQDHLLEFARTGCLSELDDAAEHIHAAMRWERSACRPAPVVVHRYRHGHHGAPRPPVVVRRYHHHRHCSPPPSVTFGGKNWGVRIGF